MASAKPSRGQSTTYGWKDSAGLSEAASPISGARGHYTGNAHQRVQPVASKLFGPKCKHDCRTDRQKYAHHHRFAPASHRSCYLARCFISRSRINRIEPALVLMFSLASSSRASTSHAGTLQEIGVKSLSVTGLPLGAAGVAAFLAIVIAPQ